MAGWFSRLIPGPQQTASEPVEFVLTCGCGQPVTGTRHRRMQVAVCRKCGSQLFVLPTSHYPRPKVRVPKQKPAAAEPARRPKSTADVPAEIRTPPPLPRRGKGKSSSGPTTNKTSSVRQPKRNGPANEPRWRAPRRRIITPLRLVVISMLVITSLVGWWALHQRALQRAVVTAAESTRSGRNALSNGEFETASREFQRAVQSLDLLHRDDREARLIRQQAREATAAEGMANISLFELLTESRQTRNMAAGDWQKILKQSYAGAWFLLDSNSLQFAEDGQSWKFTLLLVPGTEPVQVRGDLSRWKSQFEIGDRPSHFILAAQLADIRDATGGSGWEIVLDDKTIFPWSSSDTFQILSGASDEASRATLKLQTQRLGISE